MIEIPAINTSEIDGPTQEPASGNAPKQLVIFCHGAGASGNDLLGLAPYFAKVLPDAKFVAPDAPESFDLAPVGRQWFSIMDMSPDALLSGISKAAPLLNRYIDKQLEIHDLTDKDLALVGFSQGMMMALHVGLRRSRQVAGIIGYSGLMVDEQNLEGEIKSRPPVLLIHGEDDDVIPVTYQKPAIDALESVGVAVRHQTAPKLGHGLDDAGIMEGMDFLLSSFSLPRPSPKPKSNRF